jgi:hypothetical protein
VKETSFELLNIAKEGGCQISEIEVKSKGLSSPRHTVYLEPLCPLSVTMYTGIPT